MGVEDFYPFSAIVGQSAMKRALILAAIHPGLGGVLIRGAKGAAKSTAVRALAALLPEIEVFEGDPFHRAPGEEIDWPIAEGAKVVRRPVSLVNLPVGATDDRVVGSLDMERALAGGSRRFEPGILASAHRGILYIDEVNLLGDHLVDLLLDAAAMGVNHVEREGIAFRHPSRFVLVGTMNPEEGDLRPQLLDRFGLAVDAEAMPDPAERAVVVRRRLAFEADPRKFRETWAERERLEGARIEAARELLPTVVVPDKILEHICERCSREGAEGLRADLTIYKAASALAAYEGRSVVTEAEVEGVAELALAHRRTRPPQGGPPPIPPVLDDEKPKKDRESTPPSIRYLAGGSGAGQGGSASASSAGGSTPDGAEGDESDATSVISPDEARSIEDWSPRSVSQLRKRGAGGDRGKTSARDRRGAVVGSTKPTGRAVDIALAATLRAAAPLQIERGRKSGEHLSIRPADLREKVRARPGRHLVLFVVDASRSMGARERMRRTKSAVLSLLIRSYQRRDLVGLITFGKGGARLALPPTRSVRVAAERLSDLPIGGATPLAAGLLMAAKVVATGRKRDPGISPLVVLLTDGRGNLPIRPGGNPESEALEIAAGLARDGVLGWVIDTETGPVRLGLARSIAAAWGAEVKSLDDLDGPLLPEAIRRALFSKIAS